MSNSNIFTANRMRRRTYALIALPTGFLTFFSFALTNLLRATPTQGSTNASLIVLVFGLVCLTILSYVTVKRLHDTNQSGWWTLLYTLIFGVYLIVPIVLSLMPGTKGTNKYGADPRD